MADVTQIIAQIEQGDPNAAEQLLPLVYEELRRVAAAKIRNESPGQTLQATALVHEAYLRLMKVDNPAEWNGRGHFFAAAAEAMRRILIDRARNKKRKKRAGERRQLDLQAIEIAVDAPVEDLLAIDEALGRLQSLRADVAQLVKLRFFVGMSLDEAATALGISRRTAYRRWEYARAWLHQQLRGNADLRGL